MKQIKKYGEKKNKQRIQWVVGNRLKKEKSDKDKKEWKERVKGYERKKNRILVQVEAHPFRIPNIYFDLNRSFCDRVSIPSDFLSGSVSFVPFIIKVNNNHSFMCRQRVHSELWNFELQRERERRA